MGILCKYQIYITIPSYNKTWLKKSKAKWKKQISGHVFFVFFWLNEIAHFLWVSSFALALVWTFSTRGVYNFITKQTNISVNLAPFFNDVSFLFCCFLKSRVTNELKSLFLWKSKKVSYLFQTGQNFAAHKTLVWSIYVLRTSAATIFFKKSNIWAIGSHLNQIRFI